MIELPRGGIYLQTSAGPIQFGAPPETIKDSMHRGLDVPNVYVAPTELFDRRRGLSLAEFEFPSYYNYFILQRRVRLLVENAAVEARIRAVFRESLLGPANPPQESEFADDYPRVSRPDLLKEAEYFRRNSTKGQLTIDDLIEFVRFDRNGSVTLDDVKIQLDEHGDFVVTDGDAAPVTVRGKPELPERFVEEDLPTAPFEPPKFGVTVLGSSHGFDPVGKTTGFILWVGGRGLLVDPPVDSTEYLREQGVAPKLIDGVILTHCHADHDAGAFQKVLEEGRVNLYTTPHVLGSFLRKYSALSGLSEDLLRRTFSFHPVKIGAPTRCHGAELWFFYALHSIPTVGFEAFYGGKSLVFSADTLYEPDRIAQMRTEGVMTEARCDDLIAFPWHHSVVLHEAGIPPLHTPVEILADLSDAAKENLYLVHIAEKDIPEGKGLKAAKIGLEHTIRVPVEPPRHADAIEMLDIFHDVDLFTDFISRAREILQAARIEQYEKGRRIVAEGQPGDRFYIVVRGVVSVMKDDAEIKTYQAGDYFGETSLVLGAPRNADVFAKTDVELVEIQRYDFLYLLRGTNIQRRLVQLARMREEGSWEIFEHNGVLRSLTSAQKTQLQSYLRPIQVREAETLWNSGDPPDAAFIVDSAEVAIDGGRDELTFTHGAFLGEADALRADDVLCETSARVTKSGRVFRIERDDLERFFEDNPGLLVSFIGTRFVE